MHRKFSRKDVQKLINFHESVIEQLTPIQQDLPISRKQVENSARSMAATAVREKMIRMPVEELNRNKNGIRVKMLRENGYTRVGQLTGIDANSLKVLHGFSEDSAYKIVNQVNRIQKSIQEDYKIRISADYKTIQSDQLILAIYRYNCLKTISEDVDRIFQEYKERIESNITLVKPATASSIGWLFTPRWDHRYAINAYDYLDELFEGEYKDEFESLIKKYKATKDGNVEIAWDDYIKNPISYVNTLEEITPEFVGRDDPQYGLSDNLALEIQNECLSTDGLKCQLRPYQVWGVKYILHQTNVLLGDEMGLGKTIQSIATMVSLRNSGATHFIVVCPASVLTNWCREIKKIVLSIL